MPSVLACDIPSGEMETLLRNLDARTLRMKQILPTLATKLELGRVEDTQHRLLMLMEDTRGDVRLLAEHVASALERLPRHH